MDRPRLNFVIDCLMFVLMSAIVGLGLLMKYVLIPGRERWAKYGRNVELTLFGWDRHDWGTVHFYLALLLLAVLTVHLILHWQMIVALFQRLIATPRTRTIVLWIFVLFCLLLVYFPFLVTPEVQEIGRGRGPGRGWRHSAISGNALSVRPGQGCPEESGRMASAPAGSQKAP